MKPKSDLQKVTSDGARAAWARLNEKQRRSVVGRTFHSIFDLLDGDGNATLLEVLQSEFDGLDLRAAHTTLKTQFVNRPPLDSAGQALLKLCVSRIAKGGSSNLAESLEQAAVWFEVPVNMSVDSLSVPVNKDVAERFTETKATDQSAAETLEQSKSDALRTAEVEQLGNGRSKSALNFGNTSMRHGAQRGEYLEGTYATDAELGTGDPGNRKNRAREPDDSLEGQGEGDDFIDFKAPPSDLKHESTKEVEALPTLLRWASDNSPAATRLYALLGDSGTGKTTHGQEFTRILNGESTHAEWPLEALGNKAPKALFIDLAELSGVPNLSQLSLEEMLVLVLKRRDGLRIQIVADVAPLVAQARTGDLIFVFDGLDELLKNDPLVLQKVFEQFIKVVARHPATPVEARPPKVIVSCRSHYFRDVEAQHSFFTARGRSSVTASDYRCLTLLPWGNVLIERYLSRRVGAS